MGREVRRVPAGWQHPRDERGYYIPLHGESGSEAVAEWEAEKERWDGPRPQPKDYMPDFKEPCTHLQMYEDCSEGTPISPVLATAEELAQWLADNGASAFGDMTATYDQWLATIKRGWAPSAVFVLGRGGLKSGVEDS